MSPSTIGGIIGAGIGFVVGGPAGARWGWMLGGMAGSIISPERYEGPRLDEARVQTSQDGVPLIYGYGTFPCMGNLAWIDEVKEHRHKRKAKGTPEQVDYTYTRSYMIVVCKGEISGYKIIKRNGKIVYDARTDAELSALGYSSQEIAETRAAQANFLQRATLYYGTDTQTPDPTMVAVKGAGNVPAYTGIAYIVLKDDETREGETAQFEFVVAVCGERREDFDFGQTLVVTGLPDSPGAASWVSARATDTPAFAPIPESTSLGTSAHRAGFARGACLVTGVNLVAYSSSQLDSWHSGSQPWGANVPTQLVSGHAGWLAQNSSGQTFVCHDAPTGSFAEHVPNIGPSNVLCGYDGSYYYRSAVGNRFLSRSSTLQEGSWEFVSSGEAFPGESWQSSIHTWFDVISVGNILYATVRKFFLEPLARYQIRSSVDGGVTWPNLHVDIEPQSQAPYQLCVVGEDVVCLAADGRLWTSGNSWGAPFETGLQGVGSPASNIGRLIVASDFHSYALGQGEDGDSLVVFNPKNLSVSSKIIHGVSNASSIACGSLGRGSFDPIPDAPGYYINRATGEIVGPSGTQIDPCEPNLAQIVAGQCNRRGVSDIDVSELIDPVTGYRVATPSTSQRNIQGLQPGYFFSASEFDGTLHFPKRGRELTFALTHDDFVERDGDPIQWETTQEAELPRKVTVAYVDPATSYSPTTQQAERRAATVKAEGETAIELAITGQKDWAAQVSDKAIKVSWGESEECTFHVTIDHADLVTGAEGTVPYLDGSTTVVRIERIEDEGLVRMVTARRTRKNLYESNASGAAKPLPRFPGSNIRGATDGLLLNIPILIDSDDRPGIHWAASRMMSGWAGGQFQILRAGQWVVAGETSDSAAMGALLSPLPYHSGDIDTANVLRIRINDDLESVTFTNLLQERNPLAIVRPDGTAEIVQFQAATETAPGEYELTMLLRNRVNTGASAHATGARVVFLDERVQYATLEPTDIGQTLTYRFVSFGTDPDAAPIQTYDLTTMVSQMEWPVEELAVEQDGDDFSLSWLERERLGTDVFPIRSTNWRGYEVSYSYPGGSGSVVVLTPSHTFTIPGATDITFSVAQLNQFTGAGPARTVHIP